MAFFNQEQHKSLLMHTTNFRKHIRTRISFTSNVFDTTIRKLQDTTGLVTMKSI